MITSIGSENYMRVMNLPDNQGIKDMNILDNNIEKIIIHSWDVMWNKIKDEWK